MIERVCRISVTDAMAHPYLRDFYGQVSGRDRRRHAINIAYNCIRIFSSTQMHEPNSDSLFDFDFEKGGMASGEGV